MTNVTDQSIYTNLQEFALVLGYVVTGTEQDFNERGLSNLSWRHLLLWECADILIALGSLIMQPLPRTATGSVLFSH